MQIEIKGISLKRTKQLSEKKGIDINTLALKIYSAGLTEMENEKHIADLNDDEKQMIAIRPTSKHSALAVELHKPIKMIKAFRLSLAAIYIREGHITETDEIAARKFGLDGNSYSLLRRKLGFLRKSGKQITDDHFKQFGTVEEVHYALTKGGMNITDLMKLKGIKITRERARQILAMQGISGKLVQRELLWYAHQMVGLDRKELAMQFTNTAWVNEQLMDCKTISKLADKIGVPAYKLRNYICDKLQLK